MSASSTSTALALIGKLGKIREYMNERVFERQSETDGILLTILSGLSCLFLGDVGTAKTYHIRMASQLMGLTTFDILLSETTRPDHIFGPPDIPALAKGSQYTKTKGYAPDAEVLFFDEVFKANAIVLNPMLWLWNEHLYRNGDLGVVKCPTMATFAASNEIPTDAGLRAIYDRLAFRFEVSYMREQANVKKMITAFLGDKPITKPLLTRDEVLKLRAYVVNVDVPDEVKEAAIKTREQIQIACGVKISDRRLAWAFRAIQASAIMNGRPVALIQDTEVLANLFWDTPDQQSKVQAIVYSNASSDISDVLSYDELAENVWHTALKSGDMSGATKKLQKLLDSVKGFKTKSGERIAQSIQGKIERVRAVMEQRSSLTIIKIHAARRTWFKLSAASAVAWSPKQLLECNFHFSRTKGYWHTAVKEVVLLAAIKNKLGVSVNMQEIGSLEDGGVDGDGDGDEEAVEVTPKRGPAAKKAAARKMALKKMGRAAPVKPAAKKVARKSPFVNGVATVRIGGKKGGV